MNRLSARPFVYFMALLLPATTPERARGAPTIHWPSFRGPNASGVADGFPTATTWNIDTGDNIRWKTAIPGLGHSSPIIWGDRIFLTTAVPASGEAYLKVGLYGDGDSVKDDAPQSWRILCLDKKSGKILWEKEAHQGTPKIKRHPKASHANSTPATDGSHLVAFFGSEGLYTFDLDGNLKWSRNLGVLDAGAPGAPDYQWGFASSPIIHDGKVIVQCDVQGDSFLAAFNLADGTELWRAPRDEDPTWSTPTVCASAAHTQVVCNGYKRIGGYDLATGKELWWMKGGGDVPVPTPVVAHDLIYITNAHGSESPIYAIRPAAEGDITLPAIGESNTHIAWSKSRRGNYMQTPLVYRDHLYMCKDNGIFTIYHAQSGEQTARRRIGGGKTGFTASMIAADGKVYVTSEEGDVYVLQAGPEFKLLSTNALGDLTMATPAASEGALFFRTQKSLIAVAPKG